jgi:hypothetical protein
MKRVLIAAAAASLALPVLAGGAKPLPVLRLTQLFPPSARGQHFVPGERVGVTLSAGKAKQLRYVHASATGAFTVTFTKLSQTDRCGGTISVVAVGARKDQAVYKQPPLGCPVAAGSGPSVSASSSGSATVTATP